MVKENILSRPQYTSNLSTLGMELPFQPRSIKKIHYLSSQILIYERANQKARIHVLHKGEDLTESSI